MCGIVGLIDRKNPVDERVVERMTDRLHHRGPDDSGVFANASIGLGHRRLSILDLSTAGSQPMATPSGRHVVVFNGEVYNFRELRAELEKEGIRFHSQTDTEVVLHALVTWGASAIERLNGMFALAFFDKESRDLLVARDRLGIKPLYYCDVGGTFLFASEMRALLSTGIPKEKVSYRALAEYLTFQNMLSDQSLVEDIKVFPAGNVCILNAANGYKPTFKPFWSPDFAHVDSNLGFEEAQEELISIYDRVIRRQMISDVKVGAYLSGGLDSGSINAACRRLDPDFQSITIGFDTEGVDENDRRFDEMDKAIQISKALGTQHRQMRIGAHDLLDVVSPLSLILEEPRVGQSYPNYYAARLAADHVKVVLTGTGGDELFGGYTWRYFLGEKFANERDLADRVFSTWNRVIPLETLKKAAIAPELIREIGLVRDTFDSVFLGPSVEGDDPARNRILLFELRTFLHGLLMVDDKINMNFSIESRVPLLDNELVDFSLKLPNAHKMDAQRGGKLILRAALQKAYPELPIFQDKLGFSAPDASWFKRELKDAVIQRTMNPSNPLFHLLKREEIANLVDDHMSSRVNRRGFMWSLLTLQSTLGQLNP